MAFQLQLKGYNVSWADKVMPYFDFFGCRSQSSRFLAYNNQCCFRAWEKGKILWRLGNIVRQFPSNVIRGNYVSETEIKQGKPAIFLNDMRTLFVSATTFPDARKRRNVSRNIESIDVSTT